MSTSHKSLLGGAFPNHIIPLDRLDEDTINSIIRTEDRDVKDAYEIKIAVIIFQQCRKGEMPHVVIAIRLQSNNEESDFNQLVATAVHAVSLDTKRCRLFNAYVDGVSVNSHFIRTQLCDFLDGKQS